MPFTFDRACKALTSLFGSFTVILTVLFVGSPERITEDLVVALIVCFSLWATLGRYWGWIVLSLWALSGGS